MGKKILWVSRHPVLPVQFDFLSKKFGGVSIRIFSKKVPSAEWLYENEIKEGGYDIVIPVLPLSIVARLVELSRRYGFEVWWSEMELLHNDTSRECPEYNPSSDAMVEGYDVDGKLIFRHYRFKAFKRIKAIRLELEDVGE